MSLLLEIFTVPNSELHRSDRSNDGVTGAVPFRALCLSQSQPNEYFALTVGLTEWVLRSNRRATTQPVSRVRNNFRTHAVGKSLIAHEKL
jgi:hypothetical protein